MSQSEHSCKAVLEQGSNKGKQCDRPVFEYGYCGKHQKQAEIENAIKDGKRKCSRNRCTETFIPITKKEMEYCDTCKKAKDDLQASLTLCKWTEIECKKPAKPNGFCGKHEPRGLLLEKSKESGIRICDDGKRACKNHTRDNKLKCDECLEKDRKKDSERYNEKRDNLNICLGCGKEITELLDGKRDKVQRCSECYEKLKKIEENRGQRNRNYLEEKKENLEKYLLSYIQCAKTRNIAFELTKDQFEELVVSACYYCGSYNDKEVVGVDRINSSKNYTIENCVPCCKTCNFMKGTLSKNRFITQAHKIAIQHRVEEMSESEEEGCVTSTISPSKVAELYRNGKLGLFIDQCIKDKRSPLFIEKLKGIQEKKMSYNEFKVLFRSFCKSDSKLSLSHQAYDRKRISYKEIYGYFNNKNSDYAIEIYEKLHGIMPGFKEDMKEISKEWDTLSYDERTHKIFKVMVKYQNQRAHGTVKPTGTIVY